MFALMLENTDSPATALELLLDSLREKVMVPYVQELFSNQSVLSRAAEFIPMLPNYPALKGHLPLVDALLFSGQHSELQL